MNASVARPPEQATALRAWLDPARTAVLVIDMQADFGAQDGALGRLGVDMAPVAPALAGAERLVRSARAAGAPVVFVGLFTAPETDSPAWSERMRRQGGDPDADAALCRTGQPGAAFIGPQPAPGELVVRKGRYSGFYGTDLAARLRAMGVDTLVVAGLTTECCVASTVGDAHHLDFHVFVAADACAAYEDELHASALKIMQLNSALLTSVAEVQAAWAATTEHS